MDLEIPALLAAALALGLAHCIEPDHLAAIASLVAHKTSRRAALLTGVMWGLGHTVTLVTLGIVMRSGHRALGSDWPEIDFAIGLTLIILGGWRLLQSVQGIHLHSHQHPAALADKESRHRHFHLHWPLGRHGPHRHSHLPFYIGILHGLAGSATIIVLLPALLATTLPRFVSFLFAFGAVTAAGMAGMAALMAWGSQMAASRGMAWGRAVGALAGAVSMAVGIVWTWNAAAAWV